MVVNHFTCRLPVRLEKMAGIEVPYLLKGSGKVRERRRTPPSCKTGPEKSKGSHTLLPNDLKRSGDDNLYFYILVYVEVVGSSL